MRDVCGGGSWTNPSSSAPPPFPLWSFVGSSRGAIKRTEKTGATEGTKEVMETLKWVGNLKGVEGRAGGRGLAVPAGLCMKHFFSPPSSATVSLQPSPCLATPPPRAKKSFSVQSASRSKRNWAVCSPECFAKLHCDPSEKKKGSGACCSCSRGFCFFFGVVIVSN